MTLGTSFTTDFTTAFDSLLDADSFDFGLPGTPDPDGAQPTPEDMLNEAGGSLVGMVVGGSGTYGSFDNPFTQADKDIWREFGGWYEDDDTLIYHEPGFRPGTTDQTAKGEYIWSDDGDAGFLFSNDGIKEMLEEAGEDLYYEMAEVMDQYVQTVFGDVGSEALKDEGTAGTTTTDDGLTLTDEEMAEVFARLFGGSDPLIRTGEYDGLDVLVVEDAEAFAALMRAGGPLDPDAMTPGAHPEYDISPEALDAPLINPGLGDDPLG